jgi:hypothetical protein
MRNEKLDQDLTRAHIKTALDEIYMAISAIVTMIILCLPFVGH